MKTAYLHLREQAPYRREAFAAGLAAAGFRVHLADVAIRDVKPGDVLCIWNRYGHFDTVATSFEKHGGTVIVAENGYLGREYNGSLWYAISLRHHNGGGLWHPRMNDRARVERLGVDLKPWANNPGGRIVILPQRGIGPPGVAQPDGWTSQVVQRLGATTHREIFVRPHPGNVTQDNLLEDLEGAHCAVIWASGAGHKAIVNGVPVFFDFQKWIGGHGAAWLPLMRDDVEHPFKPDRTNYLTSLSWAMWEIGEIADGAPFRHLLERRAP